MPDSPFMLGSRVFLAVAALVASLTPFLRALSATTPGARIQFSESVFDFGQVTFGKVVQSNFNFTNTGDQLLVIKNVHPACGCTTIKNWSRETLPGKEGTISLNFETINFSGPVGKSVTVTCNDSNQPIVTLQIKGTVWRPINISPPSANFSGALDANLCQTIRITNQDEQPLILSSPETSSRAISAELQTNQFGKEYHLLVSLVPPLGAGNLFGKVTLKTSNSKMPILDVPV